MEQAELDDGIVSGAMVYVFKSKLHLRKVRGYLIFMSIFINPADTYPS